MLPTICKKFRLIALKLRPSRSKMRKNFCGIKKFVLISICELSIWDCTGGYSLASTTTFPDPPPVQSDQLCPLAQIWRHLSLSTFLYDRKSTLHSPGRHLKNAFFIPKGIPRKEAMLQIWRTDLKVPLGFNLSETFLSQWCGGNTEDVFLFLLYFFLNLLVHHFIYIQIFLVSAFTCQKRAQHHILCQISYLPCQTIPSFFLRRRLLLHAPCLPTEAVFTIEFAN